MWVRFSILLVDCVVRGASLPQQTYLQSYGGRGRRECVQARILRMCAYCYLDKYMAACTGGVATRGDVDLTYNGPRLHPHTFDSMQSTSSTILVFKLTLVSQRLQYVIIFLSKSTVPGSQGLSRDTQHR